MTSVWWFVAVTSAALRVPSRVRVPVLTTSAADNGHVFVLHGDVRQLSADAVLYPTRNLNNPEWFPEGPPAHAWAPARDDFTSVRRVIKSRNGEGVAQSSPEVCGPAIWLGHLDGRFASADACDARTGRPRVQWYLDAAQQFLTAAYSDLTTAAAPPRNGRTKHVLAMPVVGTGTGGARQSSGDVIAGLLRLLLQFVTHHDVDCALVVKSDAMFSAAQAVRRTSFASFGPQLWERTLGKRLCLASSRLAGLATQDQLCLFLGAGVSVGAGLPQWQQLLTSLATRPDVPFSPEEVEQLRSVQRDQNRHVEGVYAPASPSPGLEIASRLRVCATCPCHSTPTPLLPMAAR